MLNLTKDELLVFFEWAQRFCETNKLAFTHYAEAVVIDKIAGELERDMTDPFQADYALLLHNARSKVLKTYEDHMGPDSWIKQLPLEQN